MTKKEQKVFDTWVGELHRNTVERDEIREKIKDLYHTNGGTQTLITLVEQIEHLTKRKKTRHEAIIALINFSIAHNNISNRFTINRLMDEASTTA